MVYGLGEDIFRWKWTTMAFSLVTRPNMTSLWASRSLDLPEAPQLWSSFVSLALRGRCRSVDRMARHGLPCHVTCPFCVIEDDCLNHLLLQCRFARVIWFSVAVPRLRYPFPAGDSVLGEWWSFSRQRLRAKDCSAFNSLILLVTRSLWMQRNARVLTAMRNLLISS
jgi:hypothetical protein